MHPLCFADHPEIHVLQKLAAARKVRLFLVGGFWRDQQLGRSGRDLDLAVSGGAIGLARQFARKIKGAFVLLDKASGCARVVKRRDDGIWTYDLTDLRAATLKGDLARRDFTVNTFAADLKNLLDQKKILLASYPGAAADLKARILRMTGKRTFTDDPLRILRAYSLRAQLGFRIEPVTLAAMKVHRALIRNVSPERVREELFKVLESARAAAVIRAMDRDGILPDVVPQIRIMYRIHQGGYHHLDVWRHSLETLVQFELILKGPGNEPAVRAYLDEPLGGGHTRRAVLKLACLLHDIGKPDTRKKEPAGRTTFHGHEHAGRNIVRIIARKLVLSTKERYALEDMVTHHLRPGYLSNFKRASDKALFRYFRDTGDEAASVALLAMADQKATRGPLTTAHDLAHHADVCADLVRRYFAKKVETPRVKLLTGHDLIREFHLQPGPRFAVILRKVEEAQHLGKITTKDEALALVRKIV